MEQEQTKTVLMAKGCTIGYFSGHFYGALLNGNYYLTLQKHAVVRKLCIDDLNLHYDIMLDMWPKRFALIWLSCHMLFLKLKWRVKGFLRKYRAKLWNSFDISRRLILCKDRFNKSVKTLFLAQWKRAKIVRLLTYMWRITIHLTCDK